MGTVGAGTLPCTGCTLLTPGTTLKFGAPGVVACTPVEVGGFQLLAVPHATGGFAGACALETAPAGTKALACACGCVVCENTVDWPALGAP